MSSSIFTPSVLTIPQTVYGLTVFTTGPQTLTLSTALRWYICNGNTLMTINLPTAAGFDGYTVNLKNIGTANVSIVPNGAQTIDGATSLTVPVLSSVNLIAYNSAWYVV